MANELSSVADYVALGNYRARVAELYSDLRRSELSDEKTWLTWCEGRDDLLSTHPSSAFVDGDPGPPPFWRYSSRWRTTGRIVEAEIEDLILAEGEDVVRRFIGVGNVEFALDEQTYELPIYWADAYGGGWILPFRDQTNGGLTFGSGRYVLDGAKGADLGVTDDGEIIIDFNYAFHPSCVWGNWVCPLPNAQASLPIAVTAGESKHEKDEVRHGYRCERFNCGTFIPDGTEHDCC